MVRPANDASGDEPPGDEQPGDEPLGHESQRDDGPPVNEPPPRVPLLRPSGQGRGSRFLAVDGSIPRPCAQKIVTFDENVESREST